MCLKESEGIFQTAGRSHLWSLYLRMMGRGPSLKTNVLLVFFSWLVKFLKNLQLITLLVTQENVACFHFQYDFSSSLSTADLQTVLSDRISRVFNRSGAN